MRTIFFILLLTLTLTACAGKSDAPMGDDNATTPSAETTGTENETTTTAEPAADEKSVGIDISAVVEPVGSVKLNDGTVIELTAFEKIGKYYIYISGKLNGRSSTVISLTRLDDLKRWAGIAFKDKNNFTIITKGQKQLSFEDSRLYIGNDSPDTYTFYTSNMENYQLEKIVVKKQDVQIITLK